MVSESDLHGGRTVFNFRWTFNLVETLSIYDCNTVMLIIIFLSYLSDCYFLMYLRNNTVVVLSVLDSVNDVSVAGKESKRYQDNSQ